MQKADSVQRTYFQSVCCDPRVYERALHASKSLIRDLLNLEPTEREKKLKLFRKAGLDQFDVLADAPSPPPYVVPQLVEMFIRDSKQKHKPATVRHYASGLKPFKERFAERWFHELTAEEVLDYLHDEFHQREASSARQIGTMFRLLQSFAIDIGVLYMPIVEELELPEPAVRDKLPTDHEFAAILEEAPPELATFLRAFCEAGGRPGELAAARIEDIKEDDNTLHVKRGDTTRAIPLDGALGPIVRVACEGHKSGHIFLDENGDPWSVAQLSSNFRRIRDRLDLSKKYKLSSVGYMKAQEEYDRLGVLAAAVKSGTSDKKRVKRRHTKNNNGLEDAE